MLQSLQGFLKVATERQQLVATNIANVDTPGYHTRDLDFRTAMQEVMDEGQGPQLIPTSIEVPGLAERPDGNNVDIDVEGMALAQTHLQYQMGVQLIKAEFHRLLTAIKD
jgi:flagellar basal-body rod protein FlgB